MSAPKQIQKNNTDSWWREMTGSRKSALQMALIGELSLGHEFDNKTDDNNDDDTKNTEEDDNNDTTTSTIGGAAQTMASTFLHNIHPPYAKELIVFFRVVVKFDGFNK
ncbi:unnamed protein product [Polarella glacialis]|uniref:Uncharacterized protein n=1 Tax=Polarella glacialis TaxID=89957 RepID=A0A813FDF2_POLGL|nr:unnamed protein product [Polarella glacialis]